MTFTDKTFYVLHPIEGPETPHASSLALRDAVLTGKKLLLLDNGKPNSDTILRDLGARLAGEHNMSIHYEKKPAHSAPLPSSQLEDYAGRFHYILTGIGD